MNIKKITTSDLQRFFDSVTRNSDVKKKAFDNLKIVLNKTFDYALKKELIDINPMGSIFWDAYKSSFVPSAPIKMRGYTKEEMYSLIEFARAMQKKKPETIKWWSYEFALLTAVRRAEIPPIEWVDVKKTYIDISKELVGARKPYTIKHSTKTGKDRKFPITSIMLDFLTRLHANNEIYHPGSKYLFPDKDEPLGCITMNVTYRAHKYACIKLGIPVDKEYLKGTHAFRRVHETTFLEKGGSLDLASKVYGNSPRVVEDNYMLAVNAESSLQYIQSIHDSLFGEHRPVADNDLLFGC